MKSTKFRIFGAFFMTTFFRLKPKSRIFSIFEK
ncbi:hypothetical protein Q787_04400 [Ornithobacterium rhinotracheale H06-030791]|nr:hypothetical protein Q785_04525 [Ornithobacterium rhinotracheale ORT-UMN 88]KGB67367.1 hypothetical protein Q787_04400 [Ornithobacterium rhinotracheale H06-030791]